MADAPGKKNFLEAVQLIQAIATVAAIIVGGIWTYRLFVLQRLAYPHLKIEHSVADIPLPDNRILLVVDIIHANPGNVKIALPSGFLKIYGLQALPDETADQLKEGQSQGSEENNGSWELLDNHTWKWDAATPLLIEPGENNQLHYEVTLDADVGPLEIYSYFRNPAITDKDIGWRYTSIYHPGHSRESTGTPGKAALQRRPGGSEAN